MRISINQQPIETTLENEKNVGEVAQQITAWAGPHQQYIYAIEIDGTRYSPHQDNVWSSIDIHKVRDLNFETFSPLELESCLKQLADISVMMQSGQGAAAMQYIVNLSVLLTRFLHILPQLNTTVQQELQPHIAQLNSTLNELVEGFEAKDSVLIADIVEYEIVPRIEKILEALKPE